MMGKEKREKNDKNVEAMNSRQLGIAAGLLVSWLMERIDKEKPAAPVDNKPSPKRPKK